jgi:hypothetical protein
MSDRFTNLRFIIGLFFVMMALIVLMGYIMSLTQHKSINLYSGISFLLFGALMMYRAAGDVE